MAGLIAAVALLAAGLAWCAYRLWYFHREAERLSTETDRFLTGESTRPSFSVRDDAFAPLENSVVELENRLLHGAALREALHERSRRAIADLSHQLKTPLSSLKLYCELDQGPHAGQQLALIERMEGLIASLLRLERLAAGVYPFDFAPCALDALCRSLLEEFRPLYPDKVLRLEGEAELRCDARWLSEAIGNLIKNACEHSPRQGEVRVTITRGEAAVSLTVSDDGGGVPEEELGRLFERFFRSSRPQAHQGAGLGLSIVREIVRRHHGTLSAFNSGSGLQVCMVLPDMRPNLKES